MILLGAGASVEAGVPATVEMTETLVAEIGRRPFGNLAQALNFVCGALVAYDSASGADPYRGLDVERVFSAVKLLGERNTLEVSPFVSAWHPAVDVWDRPATTPFFGSDLQRALGQRNGRDAQKKIEVLIRSVTGPGSGSVYRRLAGEMISKLRQVLAASRPGLGYLSPLADLAHRSGGLSVATLNYDLTFEQACASRGVAVQTGIDGWIAERRWRWNDAGTRLLKLHGSIDWCWQNDDAEEGEMRGRSVARTEDPNKEQREPVLVFGQRSKLEAEGPFFSLMSEFEDLLARSDRLITIGYSFRDRHINEAIRRWTRGDRSRTVVLVDPNLPTRFPRFDFRGELLHSLNPSRMLDHKVDIQPESRAHVLRVTASEAIARLAST